MKKSTLAFSILLSSFSSLKAQTNWLYNGPGLEYTYAHVMIGADDLTFVNEPITTRLTTLGNFGVNDGNIDFLDFMQNSSGPNAPDRKIRANTLFGTFGLYAGSDDQNGPAIKMWGNMNNLSPNSAGITFTTPNSCGSSGGRYAFEFIKTPLPGATCPNYEELFIITREGYCRALGAFDAPSLRASGLASASNTMVVANTTGVLTSWALPTLSLQGTTISLKSGTTVLGSVNIPTGSGDNLGNHTATANLNMAGKGIVSASSVDANAITGGSLTIAGLVNGQTIGITNGGLLSGTVTFSNPILVAGTTVGSDRSFKKDIKSISGIKSELFKLNGYQYHFRKGSSDVFSFDDKTHYGFIAQEVQAVFPHLTSVIDKEGRLGVNYTEFIPMLLEVVKEQDKQIIELDAKLDEKTRAIQELVARIEKLEEKDNDNITTTRSANFRTSGEKSFLRQNNPNPFSKETRIGYGIVGDFQTAFIGIYDLNGKLLRKTELHDRSSEVVIAGLEPGMYVYSLVVDGEIVESRKMIAE